MSLELQYPPLQVEVPTPGVTMPATPAAPTVTPTGADNGVSYGYRVVAVGTDGRNTTVSAASAETVNTHGPTTLSVSNFETVSWTAVTGAANYRVYRTTGGATQGLIGTTIGTSLADTGLTGDGSAFPTTPTGNGEAIAGGNLIQTKTITVFASATLTGSWKFQGSNDPNLAANSWVDIQAFTTSGFFTFTDSFLFYRFAILDYTTGTPIAYLTGVRDWG
jgi:hypothetical protein